MKKLSSILMAALFVISLSSCYTLNHTVGDGAQGNDVETQKQWYALWGAVKLNNVDSQAMADGAEDYEIKSSHKFIDYVIGAFTGAVSIVVQTVEVKK